MNNEKIAPKVFPNFHKQLKDGKIPFYISQILQSTSETSNSKSLENKLIECLSYLEDDKKLKNIFLNFGWSEKNKNFSKEINYKELNGLIAKEYQMGFATPIGQKPNESHSLENCDNESAELRNNFEAEKDNKNYKNNNYNKNNNQSRNLINLSFSACTENEKNLFHSADKIPLNNNNDTNNNNNNHQMQQEKTPISINQIQSFSSSLSSENKKANLNTEAESNNNKKANLDFFCSSFFSKNKNEKEEENSNSYSNLNKGTENPKELSRNFLIEAEPNCNCNLTMRNLGKSASKSYKNSMLSNKKNLSLASEEDFADEDSASIKKPIATTLNSNVYGMDYSKINLIQNEQNKNQHLNFNRNNNYNNNNLSGNEENFKMQTLLVNSHPNIFLNNNQNNSSNMNFNFSSPNLNPNKTFNINTNNKNLHNNNNDFFETEINNQNEIPKIITPKFNKLISTPTNNPLNNLNNNNYNKNNNSNNQNPSANFISNNKILININNSGIPADPNSNYLQFNNNNNSNVNQYLLPNLPNMHFNSSIFSKSNFTKNASNLSSHASPRLGLGFNATSAFNANPQLKGFGPLNSPQSVKSLDLNQVNFINCNSVNFPFVNNNINNNDYNNQNQNFYYFNTMNNNNNNNFSLNNNNLYNCNSNSKNFKNIIKNVTTEELRKFSNSKAASYKSNKVSGNNQMLQIKSKNLSFYEAEEENENSEDFTNETQKDFKKKNLIDKQSNNNNKNKGNSINKRNLKNEKKNFNSNLENKFSNDQNNFNNSEFENECENENENSNNQNNLLNGKNNSIYINIKKNYSLLNNNNPLEMRNNKNLYSSNEIKEPENTQNKNSNLNSNTKESQTASTQIEPQFNPNVSVISIGKKNELRILIDKKILFREKTENFALPILGKLTNNNINNIIDVGTANPLQGGRQKRNIQRNKRFFDEEHFHFDNSFKKITTPKDSQNSGNMRSFIDADNSARFIKRKRKKIGRLGDSMNKNKNYGYAYENCNNNNNNNKKNNNKNNLSFYEFNLGKRKYKKRKCKEQAENEDQQEELSAPISSEELENSVGNCNEENDSININFNNNNSHNNENYDKINSNYNSKLNKLKPNRIYQSGENIFHNNKNNSNYLNNNNNQNININYYNKNNNNINNNHHNYSNIKKKISEFNNNINNNKDHFSLGARRRKKRTAKNSQKLQRESQKRFFNSRNSSYGLKEISKNVLKIVRRCKSTTYKEISDMIVSDINADLNGTKDEKNIRRRIYDSLNVMKAMSIFKKERNLKNIVLNNSAQNDFLFSLLEKEESFGAAPRLPKGISLRNSVQPLKVSVFPENNSFINNINNNNFNFSNEFNQFNYSNENLSYNAKDNNCKNNNNAFDNDPVENNFKKSVDFENAQQQIAHNIQEQYTDKDLTNSKLKKDGVENQMICDDEEIINNYDNWNNNYENNKNNKNNFSLNSDLKQENKTDFCNYNNNNQNNKNNPNEEEAENINSIPENNTNNENKMQIKNETQKTKTNIKAIEEKAEQPNNTQEDLINSNKKSKKIIQQRKLSSESNFKPKASNSNINTNINIFNKAIKNNASENLSFNSSLQNSNLINLPVNDSACLNFFPFNLHSNANFINSSNFNAPAANSNNANYNFINNLNFNFFQNNNGSFNHTAANKDQFYYSSRDYLEDAYFNHKKPEGRSKKQLIQRLKALIADKKRVLNTRLLEVNLLKYNSDLIRKLINYNKNDAHNVKEDDKISFPFICVEFPSYKKSEVNIAINDEKTKLYCNFEEEVNIYGDLDLLKKISRINSFQN